MKILYPGTFDPLTNGHLDLIERAEKIFGNLVVAVLENTSKTPTFNLQRRIIQIKNSLSHLPNIEVISYTGLTVDCVGGVECNVVGSVIHGDHTVFVGEVQSAYLNNDVDSLNLSSTGWNYGG